MIYIEPFKICSRIKFIPYYPESNIVSANPQHRVCQLSIYMQNLADHFAEHINASSKLNVFIIVI